jgi:Fe-S cluster assembly iron-binding protein IscA
MVNVTERAKERLKELLAMRTEDASVGLRLELTPAGEFAVFPDQERADDQVVEHQGAAVLLVGQEIAQSVEDTTIDCDEAGPTPRLVMKRN